MDWRYRQRGIADWSSRRHLADLQNSSAAEAATAAVLQTQKTISHNLLISDVSICIQNLEETKSFVRAARYDSALIRTNDLISQMIQIRELPKSPNSGGQIDFEKIISQLSVIRKDFEKQLAKGSAKIYGVQINSKLSKVSDDLNKLIGEAKISAKKGE